VKERYVLADDSGLEVDALGDAPGVHSARYAAAHATPVTLTRAPCTPVPATPEQNSADVANNARLLAEMRGIPDGRREARFVCVIAVAREGRLMVCFRGEVSGVILQEPRGTGGFGYDPLFYLPQLDKTFAELSPEQKAEFSHRGLAFRKFLKWYRKLSESV
jgi:XTP/dITP diphosphohydrolase